jgi:hypothetical protein
MTEVDTETQLQRIERDIVVQKRLRRRKLAERRPITAEDAEIDKLVTQALAIRHTMRQQRDDRR